MHHNYYENIFYLNHQNILIPFKYFNELLRVQFLKKTVSCLRFQRQVILHLKIIFF